MNVRVGADQSSDGNMARLCGSAHCVHFVRLMLVASVIYGVCLMFTYTSGAQRTQANKLNALRNGKQYKYILQWTKKSTAPFHYMGEGNSSFIKHNCKYTNCFVTDNASFMDVTDFDAVIFNGRNVTYIELSQLPKRRSPKQKYIFAATESADRFPVCNEVLDDFFNWTWTYKLSSDLRYGYVTIYDLEGKEVGPAIDMKWPKTMEPIGKNLKAKLSTKTKAAAWYVSHCKTNSKREDVVAEINKELKQFGWNVDIYGSCGELSCPRKNWRECDHSVQADYYFYFAFENSFAEDYVTEKLLTALNNYAVPVVFGAADYSRFLPPGSYLNARELGPKMLARVMNDLIADKNRYYDFFRWRNHFTFKQTLVNTDICRLCDALNDDQKVNTVSVWKDFRRWWNGESYSGNCL